ncbi:dienelactone hydrolase family protein [Lysobacter humi (ex Lee et al. 2017)]
MRERKTVDDFPPEVLGLFDRYVHGLIDRRAFLAGAARFAVGATTAAGLLAALSPNFAQARQVAPDDARLDARSIDFDSPQGYGRARGYLVRPAKAAGRLPVVLVAHENRGLNPHIEDVARRLALEGFIVLAPDALHPLGGYPGDEDAARTAFGKLDAGKTRADFMAAADLLTRIDGGNGRLGVTGFCWGGGMSSYLATQRDDVLAAAPFYGPAPALEDVPRIRARMLVVLADRDERINAGWLPFRDAMEKAGVLYSLYQPPGTQHGFHNDTTPRYDEAAAREAWRRLVDLFDTTLR